MIGETGIFIDATVRGQTMKLDIADARMPKETLVTWLRQLSHAELVRVVTLICLGADP